MKAAMDLSFTLNGKPVSLQIGEKDRLSFVLRERLDKTGTKIGCGEGRCGICTVLIDGQPVKSCITPASKASGKQVLTIEGLRQIGLHSPGPRKRDREDLSSLHPLQEAFVSYGAVQCGFCTPGQLLKAYALLEQNPDPSFEEIREALNDVLCRCGSYNAIVLAVQAAARSLREGSEPGWRQVPLGDSARYQQLGRTARRPDAVAKVNGTAKFTDDFKFPGMLHARVLRAGIPSGILRGIDISAAQTAEGLHALIRAEDLPAARVHGLYSPDWPILVGIGERIRYPGDAIALVAAETQAQADAALALMQAQIEALPVISSPQAAHQPGADELHPQGNLLKHIQVRKGDTQAGFTKADRIIAETYTTPASEHLFMEPECSIAVPRDDGGMDLYVGSQIPFADRRQVAAALGLPEEAVRVKGQRTGGAFGGKEDIAGQIHAALLAQATGRPVKLLFTRRESMLVHPKRHATEIRVKLGARADGQLLACETELYGDTGAYASLGVQVMTRATTHSAGPYAIPNVSADCYAMYTNNPPAGAFRGFGVTQAAFAIESAIELLARELNLDPLELRLRNALRPGDITNTGQLLSESAGLPACLKALQHRLGDLGYAQPFEPADELVDGKLLRTCWGIAAAYKNTGFGTGAHDASGAIVTLKPNARLQVKTGAAEVGQGMLTTLQLIAAEVMGLDAEQINVFVMDTALCPDGGPTTASRQTFVSGNAVRLACEGLRARILQAACSEMGCAETELRLAKDGLQGPGWHLDWHALYELLDEDQREVQLTYEAPATQNLDEGGNVHIAFSFAAQAVRVGVDLQTGEVRVLQVLSANDAGHVLNPLGYHSQVEGGVVMGIGQALMEEFKVEEGVIISDRMARYPIPRFSDSPPVESLVVEEAMPEGPFGAKGVGEIVGIPTVPAIANAIWRATGLRFTHLPIRADEIKRRLQGGE